MQAPIYNFEQKLDESKTWVAALCVALTSRWSAHGVTAIDLQDAPAFYYVGDVLLLYPNNAYLVEVKVEAGYTAASTPHLALEVYSDKAKRKRGGAWNTRAHWYAHLYTCGLFVMMRRRNLVRWANAHGSAHRRFTAQNDGYASEGLLVPREVVRDALGRHYLEYQLEMEIELDG